MNPLMGQGVGYFSPPMGLKRFSFPEEMKKGTKKRKKEGKKKTILGNDSSKQKSERGRMVFLEKKPKENATFSRR